MPATMKDIAAKTGLGLATVSAYLNGKNLREKNRLLIEQAIKELDFEVNEMARGLKTNKTKTVGVVIPELSNTFCTSVISVMEDILRTNGYASIVCDCRTDSKLEAQAVSFLLKKMVDGIINMPVTADGSHLLVALQKNKPVVLIDRVIDSINCDAVLVDNQSCASDAVERLIKCGHKKIGVICGPNLVTTARERLAGYLAALTDNNIAIENRFIAYGDYTMDGGRRCVRQLLENKDMTALFVTNYEMTVGSVIELNRLGVRIGSELSMIGFDNAEFAGAVTPALSIVDQPLEELGRLTAKIMLSRLEGGTEPFEHIRLPANFIEGKSVCKIG